MIDRPTLIEWLMQKTITRLVLAITSKETLETVERWQFDIIAEDENTNGETSGSGESRMVGNVSAG